MEAMKKPQVLVPITVLLVLIVVVSIIIGAQFLGPKFDNCVSNIEANRNNVGGATVINYSPVIADDINWDSLSASDRETVTRLAVEQAITKADADGAYSYNITGVTDNAGARRTIFLYTGGDTVTILGEDEQTKITLEA